MFEFTLGQISNLLKLGTWSPNCPGVLIVDEALWQELNAVMEDHFDGRAPPRADGVGEAAGCALLWVKDLGVPPPEHDFVFTTLFVLVPTQPQALQLAVLGLCQHDNHGSSKVAVIGLHLVNGPLVSEPRVHGREV